MIQEAKEGLHVPLVASFRGPVHAPEPGNPMAGYGPVQCTSCGLCMQENAMVTGGFHAACTTCLTVVRFSAITKSPSSKPSWHGTRNSGCQQERSRPDEVPDDAHRNADIEPPVMQQFVVRRFMDDDDDDEELFMWKRVPSEHALSPRQPSISR